MNKENLSAPTDNKQQQRDDRTQELIKHLVHLTANRFTGYVRINFSQGSVGRVEKFEEIKIGNFAGVGKAYRKP
ncbi:MAG: hypothetical protein KQH63_12105 [Desulfobulbaceae bacterium]|nr:hypothetical protein [Desulfobulbaceae bacterium]